MNFDCVLNVVMPCLQTCKRDRATGMLFAGKSMANVARAFNSATISSLRCRFQLTGKMTDAPRSGCPRRLSNANDR